MRSEMFVPLGENERQSYFQQNNGCHIPGYTGHCPTLRFQYGTSYGTKTKEILQELRDKNVIKSVQRTPYRQHNEHDRSAHQPRPDIRETTYSRPSRYILGYTGFIPTLNFRYGKSFGRAADDSMYDFSTKQRRLREQRMELEKLRAQSAPKLAPIRNHDEVKSIIKENDRVNSFKDRELSPECPPIAGYTGYIPKVKGNEESLSKRYNSVVKRSLTLLREDRENHMKSVETRKRYLKSQDDYEDYKEP